MASALQVYNECHVEVQVRCRFCDGSGEEKEVLKRIPPGQCELVHSVTAAHVLLSATAEDGGYIWAESMVELRGRRHTHALSCACDPHTHDCPQVWLRPSSRQMPSDGAWAHTAGR